jgi:OsmC subfamily peroxiredoxin
MLEARSLEGHDRALETAEHGAHIRWIDHGDGGHGYLRADSRAFSALPLSLADRSDSSSPNTTPGELLAAAQCASFVVTLAELLSVRGTPATELSVHATCQIEHDGARRAITGVQLIVRARGDRLDERTFADTAGLALANCPISSALSAATEISIDADVITYR